MIETYLPFAVLAAVVLLGGGLLAMRTISRDDRLSARLRGAQRSANADVVEAPRAARQGALRLVSGIGEAVARSGLLSASTLSELQMSLQVSGFRGRGGLGLFVGAKLIALVSLPLVTWIVLLFLGRTGTSSKVLIVTAAVVGLLGPDFIVKSRRKSYLKGLEKGLPDALDMMVICSEAGLGLEPAIERVGQEIRHSHPAVAEELTTCCREMRMNADRRVALTNLGERTGLDSLKRLGVTLAQTLQYGTPLAQAMRTLSAEMRHEMLMRFEARAARLPALLTLPMIIFILPCVFLVVAGPAVVQVMHISK